MTDPAASLQAYRVGGCVRDALLEIAHQDSDWVVVGTTPERMQELGFKRVGKDFPVFLHPHTAEEYALARTERKTAPGYKGFTVHADPQVTLEEDLKRRDLTINAIAQTRDGDLIDPWGGLQDLQQKILRHVSDAFVEDPVRILRVARFHARFAPLGFRIAPETMGLMRHMVQSGEVDALTPERVWRELDRALGEAAPSTFILTLRECGALSVLFPEVDRLFGVAQRADYHPEIDTGIHTMMVIDRAACLSQDSRVVFAALVHDLGKGTTPASVLPRHTDHESRSVELIREMCRRLPVPNEYRDLALIVAAHHGISHRITELRPNTVVKKLEMMDAFRRPERFERFIVACQADAQGRLGLHEQPYPQADIWRRSYAAAVNVTVDDLIKQNVAGPQIGAQLHARRVAAVAAALNLEDDASANVSDQTGA